MLQKQYAFDILQYRKSHNINKTGLKKLKANCLLISIILSL